MYLAKVYVTLKPTVNDPQGLTVLATLRNLGFTAAADVRVGKYLELHIDSLDRSQAEAQVHEMCRELLSNPVIEEYRFDLEEADQATETQRPKKSQEIAFMTTTSNDTYVYVGAESSGLYRLSPGSSQWEELTNGLPADPVVPGVTIHPDNPEIIYAGTQNGPYRSTDRGDHWERLDYPASGAPVWTFMFRPGDPNVMYLGTAPGEIYRSVNGGDSWQNLNATMGANECVMGFPTRVIALAADPNHPNEMYAALEVAGVIRSADGGDTWDEITGSLAPSEDTLDLHGVQCSAATPHTVYITTRQGPFIGPDRGREWIPVEFSRFSPITYTRDLRASPTDPNSMYVSIGASARSSQGALYRSRDLFKTFERVDKGITANATMMAVSIDPRAPGHIYCIARDGQVFGTLDDGTTWTTHQLPGKAKELRGLAAG